LALTVKVPVTLCCRIVPAQDPAIADGIVGVAAGDGLPCVVVLVGFRPIWLVAADPVFFEWLSA
jgi:hypothetical protein